MRKGFSTQTSRLLQTIKISRYSFISSRDSQIFYTRFIFVFFLHFLIVFLCLVSYFLLFSYYFGCFIIIVTVIFTFSVLLTARTPQSAPRTPTPRFWNTRRGRAILEMFKGNRKEWETASFVGCLFMQLN